MANTEVDRSNPTVRANLRKAMELIQAEQDDRFIVVKMGWPQPFERDMTSIVNRALYATRGKWGGVELPLEDLVGAYDLRGATVGSRRYRETIRMAEVAGHRDISLGVLNLVFRNPRPSRI